MVVDGCASSDCQKVSITADLGDLSARGGELLEFRGGTQNGSQLDLSHSVSVLSVLVLKCRNCEAH